MHAVAWDLTRTATVDRVPVAVVICAYTDDRWDDIMDAVTSCYTQSAIPAELVVVVDHNPGLAARLTAALPNASVIESTRERGLSGARNAGVAATTAEIVAFLDDDARAHPQWLAGLAAVYSDPAVVAVGGLARPSWPGRSPRWFPDEFGWVVGCSYTGQPDALADVRNPIGCNMSFRRSVLERVGGFSSGIGRVGSRPVGCEETELCLRVLEAFPTSRIVYDPGLVVDHRVTEERTTLRYFLRRCWAEGISKSIVASLAGTGPGLSSERTYVRHVLPAGVVRNMSEAASGNPAGAARAMAIVGGLAVTVAGYGFGSLSAERRGVLRRRMTPGPRKVVSVNVAAPPPAISSVRVGSEPYAAVRILALLGGLPLGTVEIPFGHPRLTSDDVARALVPYVEGAGGLPADPDPGPLGRATVVVPTNVARPAELVRCVESLTQLDHPDYEILVVDNRPPGRRTPAPLDPLRSMPGVRIIEEPTAGASAARNAGLAAASGEIVAFTDDDTVSDPGWLRALAVRLLDDEIDCVTGLVVPLELETPAQVWFEQYGGFSKGYRPKLHDIDAPPASPLFPYAAGMFGSGNNVAYRTSSLRAIGGFDEHLGPGTPTRAGEDLALFVSTLWSGRRIAYEPSAIVYHRHRRTYPELCRQVHDYGTGLTAMLTSLVVSDPRHLVRIARRVPSGLRLLLSPTSSKNALHLPGYPAKLAILELGGMAKGPAAYWRSRRRGRGTRVG